jgi:energy-coupling factor transporter transmembrane protein EcfT
MVAYCIVLVLVLTFGDLDATSPWRFLWAVLPVLPMIWVAVAVIRHLRRLDDYQRRLNLQAFGVGFAVAMGVAITMGLLESAGLQTAATGWIIFGAGMFGWGITSIVVGRRG